MYEGNLTKYVYIITNKKKKKKKMKPTEFNPWNKIDGSLQCRSIERTIYLTKRDNINF